MSLQHNGSNLTEKVRLAPLGYDAPPDDMNYYTLYTTRNIIILHGTQKYKQHRGTNVQALYSKKLD